MPTLRGWALLIGAVASAAAGRILAIPELYEIATAAAILLSGALLLINRRRQTLIATRRVQPMRVHAANPVKVEMQISNPSRRTTEPIHYLERLGPELGGPRQIGIVPIKAKGQRAVSFEISPARRGRYRVGPGEIWLSEPFGLARRSLNTIVASDLIVYPPIENLDSRVPRSDSYLGSRARMMSPAHTGGEFFAMREYEWGDDLRKIHWASTARTGKFMIRQEELHRETSVNVVLDNRENTLAPLPATVPALDRLTSTAATLLSHFDKRGFAFSLAFSSSSSIGGLVPVQSKGSNHFHSLMENLALAEPAGAADTLPTLAALRRSRRAQGLIVVVTCDLVSAIDAFGQAGFDQNVEKIIVVHPSHTFFSPTPDPTVDAGLKRVAAIAGRRGYRVLIVGRDQTFRSAWQREFGKQLETTKA